MFAIIEIDAGLTVVELQPGESCEDAALRSQGLVVDTEPYPTYESACEALMDIDGDEDEEQATP